MRRSGGRRSLPPARSSRRRDARPRGRRCPAGVPCRARRCGTSPSADGVVRAPRRLPPKHRRPREGGNRDRSALDDGTSKELGQRTDTVLCARSDRRQRAPAWSRMEHAGPGSSDLADRHQAQHRRGRPRHRRVHPAKQPRVVSLPPGSAVRAQQALSAREVAQRVGGVEAVHSQHGVPSHQVTRRVAAGRPPANRSPRRGVRAAVRAERSLIGRCTRGDYWSCRWRLFTARCQAAPVAVFAAAAGWCGRGAGGRGCARRKAG